jgi:transcription initiation factor IIF auxiliary subunit
MSLQFRSELVRDRNGRIEYRYLHKGGREHFHVRVWLDEPKEILDDVVSVDYLLHPSFKQRLRTTTDCKNKFAITVWTYGMFLTEVTIHYRNRHSESVSHFLTFELPEDDGRNYVMLSRAK